MWDAVVDLALVIIYVTSVPMFMHIFCLGVFCIYFASITGHKSPIYLCLFLRGYLIFSAES